MKVEIVYEITSLSDYKELGKLIRAGPKPKRVVIDSLSELQAIIQEEVLNRWK